MPTYREESKKDYTGVIGHETIKIGCLQRIADATELMAKNYQQLINERDYLKRKNEDLTDRVTGLYHTIRAHKANYTRLKKKYINDTKLLGR